MAYEDLHQYLGALEAKGLLHRITKPVDKDWEIAAVCRRVFQRIPTSRRQALLFEHVRGFDVPVAVGVLGASRRVYAAALETVPDRIDARWEAALRDPVPPVRLDSSPAKECRYFGEEVDLGRLPVPVWTVGEDPGPYLTAPFVITRDPESGCTNVGTYRAQVKGSRRLGLAPLRGHHALAHFRKSAAQGLKCPVAVVIGCDPTVAAVSVASVPETLEEMAVAGALRGAALPVVPCETVDLDVPAGSEYIIEGYVDPQVLEPEGPFGEFTGYVGPAGPNYVLEITCITHRAQPIYQAFFSQMPPSESSLIRQIGTERSVLHHLRHSLSLPVQDVCLSEAGGARAWVVVQMKQPTRDQVRQAIWGTWAFEPTLGKFTVVVDEDVDPRDEFQVNWAMAFRCQPHQDTYLERNTAPVRLDPSLDDALRADSVAGEAARSSKLGIDATMSHAYPAKSLPPREHLAHVDEHWEAYGFPPDAVAGS